MEHWTDAVETEHPLKEPESSSEHHYVVRWRSSATSAAGNGRKFHDRDTAQLWARMQDTAGKKADHHWVVDLGLCDCPEEPC